MMILKVIVLCMGVICTTATAHTKPDNRHHGSGLSDLLAKFHQNDYKVKFERVELVHFNKQYLKKFSILTYKYNRTSAVVNMTWVPCVDVPDFNVMGQTYRFASNEYRLFPIRLQASFCDGFKYNIGGIQTITRCGNFTGCPFLKDVPTSICNWSLDESQLPPLVPDGQYMLELQAHLHNTEIFLIRGYGTVYRPITY